MKKKLIKIGLKTKQNLWGYFFVFPFLLGFTLFFLAPFMQTLIFSMSKLQIIEEGYKLNFLGFENYYDALFVRSGFVETLISSSSTMVGQVFFILVFSFFAAIILNQKFKGRIIARMIFFLPVIMGSGIVLQLEMTDLMNEFLASGGMNEFVLGAEQLREFLMQLRLPEFMLDFVLMAIDNMPLIIKSSGVQILIFLAGLQSVSISLYESADIEGATSWEKFWKITLPLMSPLVITNIIYSVVDFYTSPRNDMIALIREDAMQGASYGIGTAMSTLYFVAVAIILILVLIISSKFVFYHE